MTTRLIPVYIVFAATLTAGQDLYDPFLHYKHARQVTLGVAGSAVAAGALLLTGENVQARTVGRQVALLGLAEAAAAGMALWENTRDQSSGMHVSMKTDEFRQELLTGMLIDFGFITAGVLLLQHGKRPDSRARALRYISRSAFQLAFGAVNYGLIRQ